MDLIKVGIAGCLGRMGRELVKKSIEDPRINFVGGFEHAEHDLINNNLSFSYFVEFKIDDDSIIERITSRALTESRSDDSKEAIKTRLEKYYEETKPVLDYYQNKYSSIYHKIDGKQEIAKLNNLLLKLLIK